MTSSRVANLAIALAVSAWPLLIFGTFSQLGDPAPWVTHADLVARHHLAVAALGLGLVFLTTALWLSGYVFANAPKRSLCTLLIWVVPLAISYATTFG